MPTSSKWRLNISASNGGSYLAISEVQMFAPSSTTNLCTGGTASASSIWSGVYVAANAFDNNSGTLWNSAGGATTGWLEYDFASAVEVAHYSIKAVSGADSPPKSWTLEYWDGASWQATDSQSNQTGWSSLELRAFPLEAKMKWRLNISANQSGSGAGFAEVTELALRESVSGPNISIIGLSSFADSNAGFTWDPSRAFDNNTTTGWSSTSSAFPHYVGATFAYPINLAEYAIRAAQSGDIAYTPRDWALEYWNPGTSSWVSADIITGQTGWTGTEQRTFSVATGPVPAAASLTFGGQAPSILAAIQVPLASLTFTGIAPFAGTALFVSAAAAALAIQGQSATVFTTLGQSPDSGTISLTGLAPMAALIAHATVTPSAAGLAFNSSGPRMFMPAGDDFAALLLY